MSQQTSTFLNLSRSTSKKIDWKMINDTMRVMLDEVGPDRSSKVKKQDGADATRMDPELVRRAFQVAKGEFQRVLDPLRKQMKIVSMLILLSIAITISGAVIAFIKPWGGGALTLAGVGTMFGLLVRAWQLARDQAMLELIPARYELALQICRSSDQFTEILSQFMKETSSIRESTT